MVENGTDTNALTIPTDFNNISDMELMKLTGQTDSGGQGSVLGRLSINYQTEDENDKPLPRGHFVLPVDGDNVYAKEVTFRPFIRLYAYSYWDNSEEEFTSSVQMPSLGDQFADSKGTYKCGKLSREEIERLPDNDPQRVIQSSIKCNQVLYGVATMVGKKSDEQEIKVKEVPCVFYAKGVNYIPFSTMLSGLVKQKKPMIRTNLIVSTKKQKSGGNTYFSVGIKTGSTVELSDTDKELLKEFMVAVKSVNESVMEKHRSAVKSKTKDGDHSLAIELDN
jgi:hypothetical protein